MIIPALLCGLIFTSCNDDEKTPKSILSDGLYVIGTNSGGSPTNMTDLVFSDADIVSFRTGLGDMVFVGEKTAEIISRAKNYSELHFFIDGKPVFLPPINVWYFRDSCSDLDVKFCIFDDNNVQLRDITVGMQIHWVNEESSLEYAAKMQKRVKELEVLINYLSGKGKIVE